ncbi:MAG: hypothetical protein WD894_15670 [Pirellulales bacterium]
MNFTNRRSFTRVLAAVALTLLATSLFGQEQAPARPAEGGRGDDGPRFIRFGPPGAALREALDKDKDGKISADELKRASESLVALDKNKDGKLDAEEIGWPPQFGGFAGRERGRGGPGFGGPGGFGRGGRGGAPVDFGKRIMNRDANSDGRVTADELPRSLWRVVEIADENKDDGIDQSEANKMAKKIAAGGRRETSTEPPAEREGKQR